MKTNFTQSLKPPKIAVLLLTALFFCGQAHSQLRIDYGKSYVNLTKGLNGGTVEPGDTLEIRATFVVGGSGTNDYVDSAGYFDDIPAYTNYIPNTLTIRTNEGKIYKSFTDAAGDDPGTISGTTVRINLGFKNAPIATWAARGRVKYNDKPSFYGSTCIMIASFRVVVTGSYGQTINLGGGSITYKPFSSGFKFISFDQDSVMIFKNYGICTNTAANNALINEYGGTFGSGTLKNRGTSNKVSSNYTYAAFAANMPNDYYYSISNNTSTGGAGYSTSNAWPYPDNSSPSHRVFSLWDIIGDHTGAADPYAGNPATDTTTGAGGYMAVINSSYKTGIAFLDTVYNLCPNTYYQYYAWVRNICSKCACDSNGKSPSNAGYIPTAPGDSSGVYPNLTFNVNGKDYYTTGDLHYTGKWVKKAFTYLTGPTETSMVIYIRNNAPGGGGNDWAIDDIGVVSCAPNIALTPDKPDTLCQGADDTVRFKVSAFFNNYTEWKLQKSTDGGATWVAAGNDTTGAADNGSAVPVYNPSTGLYEYIVTRYFRLLASDNIVKYRLGIASTVGNLSNANCSYYASSPKVIYAIDCNILLPTSILLRGVLDDQNAVLQWVSQAETGNNQYIIERSDGDQAHFRQIGVVQGNAVKGEGNQYLFHDPVAVNGEVYYRINIVSGSLHQYSRVIMLSNSAIDFQVRALVNPFTDMISFDLYAPEDQVASVTINDSYGRRLMQQIQHVGRGVNSMRITGLGSLQSGVYIVQVRYKDKLVTKTVVKLNP